MIGPCITLNTEPWQGYITISMESWSASVHQYQGIWHVNYQHTVDGGNWWQLQASTFDVAVQVLCASRLLVGG